MKNYEHSLCHLRWGYPNISLSRSEIRTCCKTPFQMVSNYDIEKYGTEIFLNTPYQKERRLEMLQGTRHDDCRGCWKLEDSGATSLRNNSHNGFINFATSNGLFKKFGTDDLDHISKTVTIDDDILRSDTPFMLEVSLGNTCDMKCMYCNHIYSSQWATESLKNGTINQYIYDQAASKPDTKFTELFWKWVNDVAKHSVNRIGIIGGEPLITPEFYPFLDRLIESYSDISHNNTAIWIVTNLNTNSSYWKKFFDYIPRLNDKFQLEIHVSMESLYDQAEYIRNGLDWSQFEKNIHDLFSRTQCMNNVTLAFLPSITALSVPRYKQFLEWVYELSTFYKKPVMLKQNIVTWPTVHNPFVLPKTFSKYIYDAAEFLNSVQHKLSSFSDVYGRWDEYHGFLLNLASGIENNSTYEQDKLKFKQWFTNFDSLRGLSFSKTFPEIAGFYDF